MQQSVNNSIKALLILIVTLGLRIELYSQSAELIISDLQNIHTNIRNDSCGNQQLISNRAMNLFLSDKIGTYLTEYKNLSFYKNNITFNARSGEFSLSHSLFQANGIDNAVKSFNTIGVKANITNAIAKAFTDKTFGNELGMTVNRTWIGKTNTTVNNCAEKNIMDAQRESLLQLLELEIKKRENEFTLAIAALQHGKIPDSSFSKIKQTLQQDFYEQLREEFSRKFATLQYLDLSRSMRYKKITTHWTSLSIYLPIVLKRFVVAKYLSASTQNKKAYSFELGVSHTRFWETKKSGRIFLKLETNLSLNNAAESKSLDKMNLDKYIHAGGSDSLLLSRHAINTIYVGNYQAFLTPAIKFGLVYFPPNSHIGVSSTLEQNIGKYSALNWTLGIPVVLINTLGAPAANFEFQIVYFDLAHSVYPNRTLKENISVNLTVGIPFSKIIY